MQCDVEMITLRQIKLSRGTKVLLEDANAVLFEKQKIGLVGHNGCGKSSLFALLLGELSQDAGECLYSSQLQIGHLSQHTPDSTETALDFVLSGDKTYWNLIHKLKVAEREGDDSEVLNCHELLQQIEGYSKPAKAASILSGLGFSSVEQKAEVKSFSGGWRMRLSLARCLMQPADLFLLDEPTNHLDMEAILWLEKWLKQTSATVITISHDREFLDSFTTHILHIEQKNTFLYSGNYSAFEQLRAQRLLLQQAAYEKQQVKINHMLSFVQRFRAKASKAKQAQSRLNAIAKMEVIAQANIDSPFSFEFLPSARVGKPLLNCEEVDAGYANSVILNKVSLSLNPGDRIALLGPNGEGKSTLIKTLTGAISPLRGKLFHSPHLNIGYYAQHQLEQLQPGLTPVETIQEMSSDAREQTIRDFLGGFDFRGDMATSPIHRFSGGEKARLVLAKLIWEKPNLLLLDEPTNHLDLEMRAAIEMALQSYEGALVLISHDRHLLRSAVDQFYLVSQGKVTPFSGDLEDYYQWLQNREVNIKKESTLSSSANENYRLKKNLQNQLKKLEQLTESYQTKIAVLEQQLAHPDLYQDSERSKYVELSTKRNELQSLLHQSEDEWLEVLHVLENLS